MAFSRLKIAKELYFMTGATHSQTYHMQCMSCTKELLYSRSKEIEMKKTITSYLRDEVKNNKNIKLVRMSTSNNLLDEFYRYAKDHEDISLREALKNYMKNYTE